MPEKQPVNFSQSHVPFDVVVLVWKNSDFRPKVIKTRGFLSSSEQNLLQLILSVVSGIRRFTASSAGSVALPHAHRVLSFTPEPSVSQRESC
jgi:hypothetical protein